MNEDQRHVRNEVRNEKRKVTSSLWLFGIGVVGYLVIAYGLFVWLQGKALPAHAETVGVLIQATVAAAAIFGVSLALLQIARNSDATFEKQRALTAAQTKATRIDHLEKVLEQALKPLFKLAGAFNQLEVIGIDLKDKFQTMSGSQIDSAIKSQSTISSISCHVLEVAHAFREVTDNPVAYGLMASWLHERDKGLSAFFDGQLKHFNDKKIELVDMPVMFDLVKGMEPAKIDREDFYFDLRDVTKTLYWGVERIGEKFRSIQATPANLDTIKKDPLQSLNLIMLFRKDDPIDNRLFAMTPLIPWVFPSYEHIAGFMANYLHDMEDISQSVPTMISIKAAMNDDQLLPQRQFWLGTRYTRMKVFSLGAPSPQAVPNPQAAPSPQVVLTNFKQSFDYQKFLVALNAAFGSKYEGQKKKLEMIESDVLDNTKDAGEQWKRYTAIVKEMIDKEL